MPVYTLPELPYDYAALEPHYSAEVLELHHDKHHAAYVDGREHHAREARRGPRPRRLRHDQPARRRTWPSTSRATSCTRCSGRTSSPDGGGKPEGELAAAIDERLRRASTRFRSQLTEAALNVQGSGWGALTWEPLGQRLIVEQVYDHQSNVGQGAPAAARARHVGARLLPAVQEREGRLGRGVLGDRELARRRRAGSTTCRTSPSCDSLVRRQQASCVPLG